MVPEMTDSRKCREPGLFSFQDRVDGCRCLAVILPEQVSVNPQGDVGLRMAEALADRDNIDALID
jgi:hypothetical protein